MKLQLFRNHLAASINQPSANNGCASLRSTTYRFVTMMMAVILVVGSIAQAHASTPPPIGFSDSFEGNAIYPYWALTREYGQIAISKDQVYSGGHSLKFSAITGGDRHLSAIHKLPAPTKGTVSIAFYDYAPGTETLYEQLTLSNSKNPADIATVGTMDFDQECYESSFGNGDGPNANCGIYPQLTTTPVKRTVGWHVLEIAFGNSYVSIAIDGAVVYSVAGNYSFDTISVAVSGPSWRPDTVAYFDDFKFTPLTY